LNQPIKFTKWLPWEERHRLPGYDLGGVYLIAAFAPGHVAVGPADPLTAELIYVGETGGRTRTGEPSLGTLKARLSKFEASAHSEKLRHWGGMNYYMRKHRLPFHHLYVACLPFPEQSNPGSAKVVATSPKGTLEMTNQQFVAVHYADWFHKVEDDTLVGYQRRYGQLPLCNQPRSKGELERRAILRRAILQTRKRPDGG
jgi:hypothetical protein